MTTGDNDTTQRSIAWTLVIGLHLGLFWLLTATPAVRLSQGEPARLRLVWIARPPAPVLPVPPPGRATPRPRPQATLVERTAPPAPQLPVARLQQAAPVPVETPIQAPIDWRQQARDASRSQVHADAPGFTPDPLRSRRANLPGGERRDRIAMRQALTPAKLAGMIGGLFGAYPPPCPRVRQNIAGLLTSTSDRDRELLQEELRQQREYCAP